MWPAVTGQVGWWQPLDGRIHLRLGASSWSTTLSTTGGNAAAAAAAAAAAVLVLVLSRLPRASGMMVQSRPGRARVG